jgi:hypothetical protein
VDLLAEATEYFLVVDEGAREALVRCGGLGRIRLPAGSRLMLYTDDGQENGLAAW